MAIADASHFDRLVDFLKQKRENVTFHDIIALATVRWVWGAGLGRPPFA